MPESELIQRLKSLLNPRKWMRELKDCNRHRLAITFWSSLAFVGLGVSLVVFGPTLLDLANHLSLSVGTLALMFIPRAVGTAIGNVGSGVILDKFEKWSFSIMSLVFLAGIATTVVIPLSVHLAMLVVFMFLNGVAMGSIDNGVHAVLIKLWGDKSGPCMQMLHFAFALGGFCAPLIAKPFVSESAEGDEINNVTDMMAGNGNCSDPSVQYGSRVGTDLDLNCTTIDTSNSINTLLFGWAYWIAATFLILPLLAYLYYAAKLELLAVCKCFRRSNLYSLTTEETESAHATPTSSNDQQNTRGKQSLLYTLVIFTNLFFFMLFYVGTEIAFGSLIFTFAVKGELQFSKPKAAVLAAVFWGTFAFTRLFSVTLALLKVPASYMLIGNITGSMIAATIMIIAPHSATAIWIGSAVLGTSMAAIFPTTMTWMSEHVPVSGKATAVLVTGGTVGDTTIPAAIGSLIAHVSPDSLIYSTFAGLVISLFLIVILFVTAYIQKKRSLARNMQYRKLENNSEVQVENEVANIILDDAGDHDSNDVCKPEETEL